MATNYSNREWEFKRKKGRGGEYKKKKKEKKNKNFTSVKGTVVTYATRRLFAARLLILASPSIM
jgi:hypothetical protein